MGIVATMGIVTRYYRVIILTSCRFANPIWGLQDTDNMQT